MVKAVYGWELNDFEGFRCTYSRGMKTYSPYFSISYRYARCSICVTLHNNAQLIHAKFTHGFLRDWQQSTCRFAEIMYYNIEYVRYCYK
jgi:hypothetical protein